VLQQSSTVRYEKKTARKFCAEAAITAYILDKRIKKGS
jgi:hypothetical protein